MKICIGTDEISADFETAVELGVEWGVHHFELRGVGENRVPLLSDYQKEKVSDTLERYNAKIVALSPGLFKFPYVPNERPHFPVSVIDAELFRNWKTAREQMQYHLEELLPATINYAQELGVSLISTFGFGRGGLPPSSPPDEVLEIFQQAAEMAGAAGIQLAIEVEAGFWADTGERTAALVKAVNHPALGVNWDPGNSIEAGEKPYPDGYKFLRGLVQHVHFKNTLRQPDGSYRYAIDGDIDWDRQISALHKDGYDSFISVETHMIPKVQSAKMVLEELKSFMNLDIEK
jgi:sugar phosphate isomerase/epimerase